ncbi:uncharacterized [Tachysurus ichikawai]
MSSTPLNGVDLKPPFQDFHKSSSYTLTFSTLQQGHREHGSGYGSQGVIARSYGAKAVGLVLTETPTRLQQRF